MFEAKILADSLHPTGESRLVTMLLTYPRCIHSEFMTHRQFSRNAASSRAIPVKKMLDNIRENPFIPLVWGLNQSGMQSKGESDDNLGCETEWLKARDFALKQAEILSNDYNLHKQIVNRIVEPWMWITVIASAVDHGWENFFKLRCHPDAEPHIQKIAYLARDLYDNNTPDKLDYNIGHLPLYGFDGDEELTGEEPIQVSVARCARVSYLTHDGKRDVSADINLYKRLRDSGHWSPFEHAAFPSMNKLGNSNFGCYWNQHRKTYFEEYCKRAPRP